MEPPLVRPVHLKALVEERYRDGHSEEPEAVEQASVVDPPARHQSQAWSGVGAGGHPPDRDGTKNRVFPTPRED